MQFGRRWIKTLRTVDKEELRSESGVPQMLSEVFRNEYIDNALNENFTTWKALYLKKHLPEFCCKSRFREL